MALIWRVQGRNGRGPYAPGLSRKWCDDEGPIPPSTCFEAFPDIGLRIRARMSVDGGACGCGVRSPAEIDRWFTPTERLRLLKLRFDLVRLEVDEILAENADQVVFWRRRPLREGARVVVWR